MFGQNSLLVPPTRAWLGPAGLGSLQQFVPGARRLDEHQGDDGAPVFDLRGVEGQMIAVLDYVLAHPDRNAGNVLVGPVAAIDNEGWYYTGDLASMDERGYCRVEGRLKDMIIRGGENIYPREIEDLLFSHPAIAEVAVVGVPDNKYGEVVAAFIRPAVGQAPTEEELFTFCRQHLAPYKTPRYWVFVDAHPLTPSGKIQKLVLRDRFVREDLPRLAAQ